MMTVCLLIHILIASYYRALSKSKVVTKSTVTGNDVGTGDTLGDFKDTFGTTDPAYIPVFRSKYLEEISSCNDFTVTKMKDVESGTANFYSTTQSFKDFKGTDLIPESKQKYLRNDAVGRMYLGNMNFNDARSVTEEIVLKFCSIPAKEAGWNWNIQRIGPFESHGNYDWWQIGWNDVGNFSNILKKNKGIIIDTHHLVPIEDGTWKPLGHPPIHIHHIHVCHDTKGKSVRPRTTFHKYNVSLAAEQHGDYQCLEEDGGLDCLVESNPSGMGRYITTPMDVEGELNDVRAPRSPTLKWWYQLSFRWTPKVEAVKQISQEFIVGPGRIDLFDQSTYVATFQTPTAYPTIYWYTGEMWTDGTMVRNKLHGHNSIFHSAYWINASPKELGLDDPKFMPQKAFIPQSVHELGFASSDELATWILNHLDSKENKMKANPSRVICKGFVQGEKVDGFYFDRRAPCQCDPWDFKKGEKFTVISFSEHDGTPLGPHMPDYVPDYVPSHVHFVMQYIDHNRATSQFHMTLFTQTGLALTSSIRPGIYEKVLLIYNGGSLQKDTHDILRSTWFAILNAFVGICVFGLPILYLFRSKKKNRTSAEKVVDTMVETLYQEVPQKAD